MNFKILFIKGLYKSVTEEQLLTVCSKYGTVINCHLKKYKIYGNLVFKGQAIVTFGSKDEAAKALQKLPFETELGDLVDPDIFITKTARMKE